MIREEQLEEECLHLKEALNLMTVQVEKIERGLEHKVKDKDRQVKKLMQQIDMLEREKRMREDMEDLMAKDSDQEDEDEETEDRGKVFTEKSVDDLNRSAGK